MGNKILVTGGAGYVGSTLIPKLLAEGYYVRTIDNLMHGGNSLLGVINDPRFSFINGDIRNRPDVTVGLQGIDIVVHLAAIVGDPACSRQEDLAKQTNLDATRQLIDMAGKQGVKKFIFFSTCSNYGMSNDDEFLTEEALLNPVSLYAQTKVDAEKYLLQAGNNGFCGVVLRLSTIFGVSPRMRFDLLVSDFTKEAFARKKLVIYGEQFWRPYLHVADAAECVKLVIQSDSGLMCGETFNVGDSEENYQKHMVGEIVKRYVPDVEFKYVKKDEDPRNYRVSFEKIKTRLGFKISRRVEDGVRETLKLLQDGIITDYDDPKYKN